MYMSACLLLVAATSLALEGVARDEPLLICVVICCMLTG
jgi:hypothetical protein